MRGSQLVPEPPLHAMTLPQALVVAGRAARVLGHEYVLLAHIEAAQAATIDRSSIGSVDTL